MFHFAIISFLGVEIVRTIFSVVIIQAECIAKTGSTLIMIDYIFNIRVFPNSLYFGLTVNVFTLLFSLVFYQYFFNLHHVVYHYSLNTELLVLFDWPVVQASPFQHNIVE